MDAFPRTDWESTKDKYNVLPPATIPIGDNCFANVIFQDLSFHDFSTEIRHYRDATDLWNNDDPNLISNEVPNWERNLSLVAAFPTEIYEDFQATEELELEKAFIRYNDTDMAHSEEKLKRPLFNHPCNLYTRLHFFTKVTYESKVHFLLHNMNLFSRLQLEYCDILKREKGLFFIINLQC